LLDFLSTFLILVHKQIRMVQPKRKRSRATRPPRVTPPSRLIPPSRLTPSPSPSVPVHSPAPAPSVPVPVSVSVSGMTADDLREFLNLRVFLTTKTGLLLDLILYCIF
jgi:hypothetical protein